MAEQDSTTKNVESWSVLEQVPPGPIKKNLIEIEKSLVRIDKFAGIFLSLAEIQQEGDGETMTIATGNVVDLAGLIQMGVDSVFLHLQRIYQPREGDE